MSSFDIFFYAFALITVAAACFTVFLRNLVHAVFSLLFAFFGVAGLYVLLNADFLALSQLLVYVGGVLILLVFGIMLTHRVTSVDISAGTGSRFPAAIVGGALLTLLVYTVVNTNWMSFDQAPWSSTPYWNTDVHNRILAVDTTVARELTNSAGTSTEIGKLLLTDYLLPFEVLSVLLLIAMVGAAMLARKEPDPSKRSILQKSAQ